MRYKTMDKNLLPPLAHHLTNRHRIRFSNPFTTKNSMLLTLILGTVLGVSVTIDNLKWTAADQDYWIQLAFSLCHNLLLSGLLFGFCFAVYKHNIENIAPTENAGRHIAMAAIGSLVIAFAFSVVARWVRQMAFNDLGVTVIIDITTINDGVVAVGAYLITTLIFSLVRHQQMALANEQLQSEHLLTHYEALEQQVNPHFLFNSLNTLGGLIGVDDTSAQHYLQQLASTYRYIMQQHESHTVAFGEELAFVDTYCDMMQIRYGESLKIERQIAPEAMKRSVPPISVQLLVENAIKHNVISDRHPLTITIETIGGEAVRVRNRLQPKQDQQEGTPDSHIGLENLNERYKMIAKQEISIRQTEDEFVVELPLIDPMTTTAKKTTK